MDRTIERELFSWKDSPRRYPLLLRGARQVGKTYIVERLGQSFPSFEKINFEAEPEAIACFETVKPREILQKLELLLNRKQGRPITPGKTLLFLDEIQACPKAILALRYFYEELPDLHVIGAGSLLEFALAQEEFSFPVGRVQFLYLRPLSFQEFCQAMGEREGLLELQQATFERPPSSILHERFLQRLKEYFLIGGMPAVVREFRESSSFLQVGRIQELLLGTYRADFGKYATQAEQRYLRLLLDRLPDQIRSEEHTSELQSQR